MKMIRNLVFLLFLMPSACINSDPPVEDMQCKAIIPQREDLMSLERVILRVSVQDINIQHYKYKRVNEPATAEGTAITAAAVTAIPVLVFAPLIGVTLFASVAGAEDAILTGRDRRAEDTVRQTQAAYNINDKLAEKVISVAAASGLTCVYALDTVEAGSAPASLFDGTLKISLDEIAIRPDPSAEGWDLIHMTAISELSERTGRILWKRSYKNRPTHPFPFDSVGHDPAPLISSLDLELDAVVRGLMRDVEYAR